MNWYIGQEIICVKTHSKGIVKKGQTFVIKSLKKCPCKCADVLIDVGTNSGNDPQVGTLVECRVCRTEYFKDTAIWWLHPCLFAPLEYDTKAIEELIKLTQPKEQII
jgi:hypothetical protein